MRNNGNTPAEKDKTLGFKVIILILLLLLFITIIITMWALFFREPAQQTYNTPPYEENAIDVIDGPAVETPSIEVKNYVGLTYQTEAEVDLSEQNITLAAENPSVSNMNIAIQFYVEDGLVTESGLIMPGQKVEHLSLNTIDGLCEGTYEGKFVILSYDIETAEKTMVNAEIPITVMISP